MLAPYLPYIFDMEPLQRLIDLLLSLHDVYALGRYRVLPDDTVGDLGEGFGGCYADGDGDACSTEYFPMHLLCIVLEVE